tara:strand:+ start:538 stop:840 length:303 start_codon:yes stop_codon:yes gene_type:complete
MKIGYPDTKNKQGYSTSPLDATDASNSISKKRRARRNERVKKLEAKVIKNSELKPIAGVSQEDLQYTPKKGKEKKVARLSAKIDKVSEKTTKLIRKPSKK